MGPLVRYQAIEGQWEGEPFKWKFNEANPLQSTITVWSQGKKHVINQASIQWGGIDGISSGRLHELINGSLDRFEFKFIRSNDSISSCHITLKMVKKVQLPNGQISVLSIHNVDDLERALEQTNIDGFLPTLLRSMVSRFIQGPSDQANFYEMTKVFNKLILEDQGRVSRASVTTYCLEEIRKFIQTLQQQRENQPVFLINELLIGLVSNFTAISPTQDDTAQVMEVFEDLRAEDKKRFLEKLIASFGVISDVSMFERMTEAFKRLLRMSYRLPLFFDAKELPSQDEKEAFSKSLHFRVTHDPLKTLSSGNIINLIDLTVENLNQKGHAQDIRALTCYLVCVNALLEIALNTSVGYVAKETFDKFYKTFKERTEKNWFIRWTKHAAVRHADLHVNFLAHSAIQSLKLMKSDESKKYTILRHTIYALRFVAKAATCVSLSEPWQALGIIEEIPLLAKAVSFKDLKKAEFTRLAILKKAYLGQQRESLRDFAQFVQDIQDGNKKQENERKLPEHHNQLFVRGLIELMKSMMDTYAVENPETYNQVLLLLSIINRNNSDDPSISKKDAEQLLFRVKDDDHRSDIRLKLTSFLEGKQQMSSLAPPHAVQGVLAAVAVSLPVSHPSTIFNDAIKQSALWIQGMHEQKKYLQDKQLLEEGPYAIDLKGSKDGSKQRLEEILENTLAEQKLILMLGDPGSGKTLFLKKYVLKCLDNYDSRQPLPIYVPLNRLSDPRKNLIEESLQLYGLDKKELKERPTIWFLDAYDETFIGNRNRQFNIYESNNLGEWEQARFVYTCRSTELTVGDERRRFAPVGTPIALIHVCPFEWDLEVKEFFELYVKVKTVENNTSDKKETIWDKQRYIDKIESEPKLKDMVTNPFTLKLMADLLPTLVRYQIDAHATKDFLLDQWICHLISHSIKREYDKAQKRAEILYEPIEYFNFSLEVSRNMGICGKMSFSSNSLLPHDFQTGTSVAIYIKGQEEEIQSFEVEIGGLNQKKQKEIADLDQEQKNANMIQENLQSIEQSYQRQEQELQNKIGRCHRNIALARNAINTLREQLFGDSYANLRRACLLQMNTENEIGFINLLLYEYLRRIDNDNNRAPIQHLEALIKGVTLASLQSK